MLKGGSAGLGPAEGRFAGDTDPPAGSVVVAEFTYTRTTEICGGKGTARPLSQEESASDPCLDRLLLFF